MSAEQSDMGSSGTIPLFDYGDDARPELLALAPRSVRNVLDVGCASGALGMALKEHLEGATVIGVEPNRTSAQRAADRLDKVIVGEFPGCIADEGLPRFDLVVFADVLEHMVDPWQALVVTRERYLAEGGIVLASIPNIRHIDVSLDLLLRGRFRYQDSGILDRTHLRFFTRESAVNLFTSTGFEVHSVTCHDTGHGRRPYKLTKRLGRRFQELTTLQFLIVASPSNRASETSAEVGIRDTSGA